MQDIERAAVLGAGVIGASWTALFLARGLSVAVYDPAPAAEDFVRDYVAQAWPTLEELGLVDDGDPARVYFHDSPAAAVKKALFVQESVPEQLELKLAVFAEIEPHLLPEAIVSSSASGLMVREMQKGWRAPSRFVLGHPFNPPHLIPLVEVIGNERTDEDAIAGAEAFYRRMGKVTIRVRREVPGHVANRLQAALWREAIHLVAEGVASVEDVDKAIWAGPGLRWAAMGPHMLFHLAAGPGGLAEFCKRYGPSTSRWWADLGRPELTADVIATLVEGVMAEAGDKSLAETAAQRDALIRAMLAATKGLR